MRITAALLSIVALDACAALTGLSDLKVNDGMEGGSPDVANLPDIGATDTVSEDSPPISADGRAGWALKFEKGCSSTSGRINAFSFSDKDFTVALWLQVHALPVSENAYVVGQGGRPGVDGWSIDIGPTGLYACAGDTGLQFCSNKLPLDARLGHLLHVIVQSVVTEPGTSGSRSIDIFLLDETDADKGHQHLINHPSGAANNWNDSVSFAMGGVSFGSVCGNTMNATIDDVRIYDGAWPISQLDLDYKTTISCKTLGLVASFKIDEGTGNSTSDCTNSIQTLLASTYAWVPSPFP